MANEDDPTVVQSKVQYKKFDNDSMVNENDATCNMEDSGVHTPVTPTTPCPDTVIMNNEANARQQQQPNADFQPPVIEVPLNDRVRNASGQVVLQMNGAPQVSDGEPTGESEQDWNWINLILSVCSIFCCTVCGILATVTSILAYVDHRVRDFEAANKKRVAAYALALTALISGVICMIIVVALAVHYDTIKNP